jgi:RluA family pseudouridine synthase
MSTFPVEVLYQDGAILVVNKPSGLATIAEGWAPEAPNLRRILEMTWGRLWVVHRLDKVTSGVIVFARHAEAHRALNRAFEQRAVVKRYHAIVCGRPPWQQITARQPLRAGVGHAKRTAVDRQRGEPALTRFRLREQLAGHALLEAVPETGRTHQIRAHLLALGFPILGDSLYGAPATSLIARPALHAFSLSIPHPLSGEPLVFQASYPSDFMAALQALRRESAV